MICMYKNLHFSMHNLVEIILSAVKSVEDMHFSDEVIKDLSSDQRLMYEHIIGISSGNMDLRFAHRRIGPVNHARWLTLAIRLLSAYIHIEIPPENLKFLCLWPMLV